MMQHRKLVGTMIAVPVRECFADRMRRIAARNLKEASMDVIEKHPDSAHWYCLHVSKGREPSVENGLREANVEVFVPREKEVLVRHGRKIDVEVPFFPGYLLVRCVPSPAAFHGLRRQRHVLDIIGGTDGRYHVIRDEAINAFKNMTLTGIPRVATDKTFKDGDEADIVYGPFVGFCCLVLSVKWSRQAKARVLINLPGRQFEIDSMPLAFLKKL